MDNVPGAEIVCILAAADIAEGKEITSDNRIAMLGAANIVKHHPSGTFAGIMAQRALEDISAWWTTTTPQSRY